MWRLRIEQRSTYRSFQPALSRSRKFFARLATIVRRPALHWDRGGSGTRLNWNGVPNVVLRMQQ